jgi:hydrogenase maturation protease
LSYRLVRRWVSLKLRELFDARIRTDADIACRERFEMRRSSRTMMKPAASHSGPKRALLFACGNTLRGDDGVAWRIGCTVAQQVAGHSLTVVMTRQLLPEHAEAISEADIVVFVDCSAVSAAGTVSSIRIEPADDRPRILPRQLDPGSLLRLAGELYERTPTHAVAITIGGKSFEMTDCLSKPVKAAVPKALEAVRSALLGADAPAPLAQLH